MLAVEPSEAMREQGKKLHPGLQWLGDRLPDLPKVAEMGNRYDMIHLSAVWMHLDPSERDKAFSTIVGLANPAALLSFLVRCPHDPERGMHPTDPDEIPSLARKHGGTVIHQDHAPDHSDRPEISWMRFAVRL